MSAYSGWFWSSRQSTHWNQKRKPTASFNRHPSKSSNTSTRSSTFAVQGIMPNSIFLLLLNSILNNNLCRSQCWGNVLRTADADSEVGFSRGAHYSIRDPCPKRHHSVFSEEIIKKLSVIVATQDGRPLATATMIVQTERSRWCRASFYHLILALKKKNK